MKPCLSHSVRAIPLSKLAVALALATEARQLAFLSNAAAPAPATAPAVYEAVVALPACNWTLDSDGVVRRADCEEIPGDVYGRVACKLSNQSFPTGANGNCQPPVLNACPPIPASPLSDLGTPLYVVTANTGQAVAVPHGTVETIACASGAAPAEGTFSPDTWDEEWYKGPRALATVCNNGTWTHLKPNTGILEPVAFACAAKEQIKSIKELHSKLAWTVNEVGVAEAGGFQWIDADAIENKKNLKQWQNHSQQLYNAALEQKFPSIADLNQAIDALARHVVSARGQRNSEDTCKDLQNHFHWPDSTTPSPFICRYAVDKKKLGYDENQKLMYAYRDGCYCESNYRGLCPYRAELRPSYRDFGFDSLDQREIQSSSAVAGLSSDGASSRAATTGATAALCWYWSNAKHPEWGYVRPLS